MDIHVQSFFIHACLKEKKINLCIFFFDKLFYVLIRITAAYKKYFITGHSSVM